MNSMTPEERRAAMLAARPWTPGEDTILRSMWSEGKTLTQIGAVVGRTRNSVVSRRQTLQLASRAPGVRRAYGVRSAPGGNNNPCGWSGVPKRIAAPPRPPMKPKDGNRYVPSLPVVRPVAAPVALMKLHRRSCRYIGERPELLTLDTRIYCGALTDGGSWCPEHRARCIVPLRTRFT